MAGAIDMLVPYGGDISLAPLGDLMLVVDTDALAAATIQLVVTIIWTTPTLRDQNNNPVGVADDPFAPTWGGGGRAAIGENYSIDLASTIIAQIESALSLEPTVANSPPPVVTAAPYSDSEQNVLLISVTGYTSAGQPFATPDVALPLGG